MMGTLKNPIMLTIKAQRQIGAFKMARKKFYKYESEDDVSAAKEEFSWKVGLYIRLSREDGDKAVSDSIVNQTKMLTYYINDSEEFTDYEIFADENITGTNFNRPAFQQMIRKIEKGDINCVVVKDLSRFGRDYLGAGHYLENVFKKYKCRFISIIDDIDSHVNEEMIMGLMVRVKNLAHDNNSQKISMSIRKTHTAMRKKGKYLAMPPYGYTKDPKDKHHLLVDYKVVHIIKDIYKWYIEGYGTIKIAEKLNILGVSAKSDYKVTGSVYVPKDALIYKKWRPNTVRRILENKVYFGAVAQHKFTTANYKDRKRIYVPENEQDVVYNMHEPIIPKETFNQVRDLIKNRCSSTPAFNGIVHLFAGYVKCIDCGYAMLRNSTVRNGKEYAYYKCRTHNQQGPNACDHNHSIREDLMYRIVLDVINKHIGTLMDLERITREINKSKKIVDFAINYDRAIKLKIDKIQKFKNLKYEIYTSWKIGEISKDDYQFAADKQTAMIEQLQSEKEQLEKDKSVEDDIRGNKFKWLEDAIAVGQFKKLSRTVIVTMIDNIYVTKEKGVKIVFKYGNEFERLSSYVNNHADVLYGQEALDG